MIKQGEFLFISNDFYDRHDPEGLLLRNKGEFHNRPCSFAFPDQAEPAILWCVPISSKVEKYERIVERKLANQVQRGDKNPKCNTIRFGEIMGHRRAFLIQNMFPVTKAYVTSTYMDRNTGKPVTVANAVRKDICGNAKYVSKLVARGYTKLVFSDIQKTYADLIKEVQEETARGIAQAEPDQPRYVCRQIENVSETLRDNLWGVWDTVRNDWQRNGSGHIIWNNEMNATLNALLKNVANDMKKDEGEVRETSRETSIINETTPVYEEPNDDLEM